MSKNEAPQGFCFGVGFVVGALCAFAVSWGVAEIVESHKVGSGYLTFENKVYSVELFDTLEIPEKGETK